ncbi:unnamed protein product [Nippostrongylus brasiliensis]|uniref:28S ribosomal protein S28, mitochondrial (inferred by orthology to a human protein) n=1 Tax=Nippostrongylus brasiliensis TaxID=27835 RepID=A0A0N4YVK0_NIPBR|nr:unnamed protein product [Nippostrongylus brasiliensis]
MRVVFLCVVITRCIAEWTVNLEYSLNNFSEVYPLGSIELRRSFDGNYTGSFRATSGSRPDTQQFVQMMERERRSRQHGAEADDRSFLGKYEMRLVSQALRMSSAVMRVSALRYCSAASSSGSAASSSDSSDIFDEFVDSIGRDGLTFSRMLRQSKFVDLGDFNGRLVTGRIVLRVQDDLYIDVGLKFNAVCKVPAVNSEEYREGAVVLLRLHDPELSERFLGSDRDLTLLEADATLMRLLRSGSGKGGPQRSKGGERTGKPTSPSTETSPQIAADAAA